MLTLGELKYFSLCDEYGLENFNIDIDMQKLIPVIKRIQEINPNVKFLATPWSAPEWMKYAYFGEESGMCGGQLNYIYEQEYIEYLIKYIKAYLELGIEITYITLQNEPLYGSNVTPTMWMSAEQQANLVRFMAGALSREGLTTKIIIHDHNTDTEMYQYVDDILSTEGVLEHVYGVGIHGYADLGEYPIGQFVEQIKQKYPSIKFLFTEMTAGNLHTDFSSNMAWALNNIILPSYLADCEVILYFNLVLDEDGMPFIREDWLESGFACVGLIELYNNGEGYRLMPEFYALMHLSKFARTINGQPPKRLSAISTDPNIVVAASIQSNNKVALTIFNQSNQQDITIAINQMQIYITIPENSLTTLIWFD